MVPRFCPIHQKIHVCDEQNPVNKNKAIDRELSSKVRRLHGIQTQEDIEKEERMAAKQQQQPEKGTLAYILNHAKAANSKIKSQRKEYEDKDGNTIGVSDNELSSRMAMLRSRLGGGGGGTPAAYTPPNKDAEAEYIAAKAERGEKLSLREIVELAKHNNTHSTKNKEYVPPKRSNMSPDYVKPAEEEEETIYRVKPAKKSLEKEIKAASSSKISSRTSRSSTTTRSTLTKSPSRTSGASSTRERPVRERPVRERTSVSSTRERPVRERTSVSSTRERPVRERTSVSSTRERPVRERTSTTSSARERPVRERASSSSRVGVGDRKKTSTSSTTRSSSISKSKK